MDYIFAGGKRVAKAPSEAITTNTEFYHGDHLGSARLMTNASGGVVANGEATYLPYGQQYETAVGTNHYKFTGKERDSESGLDYFGARYYGSTMGRFLTPDWAKSPTPVPYADFSDPQSLNLYGYVGNRPVAKADSDGHCPGMCPTPIILQPPTSLDEVQTILDWAGFAGPIGPFADGLNAGISYARGKKGEAALNLAAMIPLGGDALKAAKMGSKVFATALEGGKHAGFLGAYANRSLGEISKGIDSLGKQVAEHEAKLADPAKHAKDWDKMSAKEQQGLLKYWQKEITNYKEQKEILEKLKEVKTK